MENDKKDSLSVTNPTPSVPEETSAVSEPQSVEAETSMPEPAGNVSSENSSVESSDQTPTESVGQGELQIVKGFTQTASQQQQNETLQSIINEAASVQPQDGEKPEEEKKRRIPKITLESFFTHKRLKRKVKIAIVVYIIAVIVPILYEAFLMWQRDNNSERQWKERQSTYILPLQNIDLARLSEDKRILFSAYQATINPAYALYAVELLAQESRVGIVNPNYSVISTRDGTEAPVVVRLIVTGSERDIIRFMENLDTFKPIIVVNSFGATKGTEENPQLVQASFELAFAKLPEIEAEKASVDAKISERTQITFPVPGSESVLEIVEELRMIEFEGVGTHTIGKRNLFSSR